MSKFVDAIIGHAIGDAMGVPTQFCLREHLLKKPVTEMAYSEKVGEPAGSWSDDTSMEIATIDSFIECGKFDYYDIMAKWVNWITKGEYTPNGRTFDVGNTGLAAIRRFSKGTKPLECGMTDFIYNGNGSLMRILPVALYSYRKKLEEKNIIELSNEICSLTNAHDISKLGCYIYVRFIIYLLEGKSKEEAYNNIQKIDYSMYNKDSIERYSRILDSNIKELNINDIKSTGYVVDTLECALWIFLNSRDYRETIISSTNIGNDTDTIGGIAGSMAGIVYGIDSIPKSWLEKLIKRDYLIELAEKFEECFNDEIENLNENVNVDNNIEVVQGDLTSMNLDIIVNAANVSLLGGGGIDGVIHYKAGPELLEECKKLNGCEVGSAKMTDAYNLPCKKIIHACGPIYYGNREKAPIQLESCYKKCLELAEQYRIDNKLEKVTIGIPCISTGIYGYPKDEACKIAIDTIKKYANKNLQIKLVCYEELDYKLYVNYLNGIEKGVFEL